MTKIYKVDGNLDDARKIMNLLKEKCKVHDWWYSMSDDHAAWKRGSEQRKDINQLVKILANVYGLGERATEIYYKHAPEEFLPKEAAHDGQGESP
tara:strand:+ start:694 stop:978 length:285 start_codon:yes stop_codon:yes gene_type:complete